MALDDATRGEVGRIVWGAAVQARRPPSRVSHFGEPDPASLSRSLAGGAVLVGAEDVLGPDDLIRVCVNHVFGDSDGLDHVAIVIEPANAGAIGVELDGALPEILVKGSIGMPWHTAFLSSACGHDAGSK